MVFTRHASSNSRTKRLPVGKVPSASACIPPGRCQLLRMAQIDRNMYKSLPIPNTSRLDSIHSETLAKVTLVACFFNNYLQLRLFSDKVLLQRHDSSHAAGR